MGWRRNNHKSSGQGSNAVEFATSNAVDELIKPLKSTLVISTMDFGDGESTKVPPTYTPEQVAMRNGAKGPDGSVERTWIVIKNKVYDVTQFMLLEHPGGREVIQAFAGLQCDWQFDVFHHPRDLKQWENQLFVGYVFPVPKNPFPQPPKERKADWRTI